MKTPLAIFAFLVISISLLSAGETKYFSKLVHGTDAPLRLELAANYYMEITDFKQSTTGADGNEVVGVVVVFKGGSPDGVAVASANSNERVVLAGPITVVVASVPGSTLFINYLLGRN